MLNVPVLVGSYGFTGVSHSFGVGERQSWSLVAPPIDDFPVPSEFFAAIDVDCEQVERDGKWTSAVLRADGLTAWWVRDTGEPPPRRFKGWFRTLTSEDAPEDMPPTIGIVTALWAVSVFYPAPKRGTGASHWARLMGVRSVSHTDDSGSVETVYAAGVSPADVDLTDGAWWDAGWLAALTLTD